MTGAAVRAQTVADVLAERARETPDRTAFAFVERGAVVRTLTDAELDRAARRVAAALRDAGARGRPVLLAHPTGAEFVAGLFGCLYAGAAAVPVPAGLSSRSRALERLTAIARDCGARHGLGPATGFDGGPLGARAWLPTAEVMGGTAAGDAPSAGPRDPALLQYTSGSTAAPRGVPLTHANLAHNVAAIASLLGPAHDSVGVNWLPPHHDMGLVGTVLVPVVHGTRSVLLSPLEFLQRPWRWLEALHVHRGTVAAAPSFAYDLCVRATREDERRRLDLGSWRVAFDGAEPISAAAIDAFADAFAPSGFRREAFLPCYGLAEATLMVTRRDAGAGPAVRWLDAQALCAGRVVPRERNAPGATAHVSCGRPIEDTRVSIARIDGGGECTSGEVGEIRVQGPGVTVESGGWLATGDLGVVLDGELYVTGRIKELIVVAGAKHHPHDVERTAEAADARVRRAAAFSVDPPGAFVVACEVGRPEEADAVRDAVRVAIAAAHGIVPAEVALLRPGTLPYTSSGKLQRHLCREAWQARAPSG